MTAHGAGDEPPQVGSVAEEAMRLLGAWSSACGAHAPGSEADSERDPGAARECSWCPVCRTAHAVRECAPEVREHLSAAMWSLGQALSAFAAATRPDPSPRGPSGTQEGPVEKIDLDPEDTPSPDDEHEENPS